TARDESGAHVIPFAHIAELLLTESASGRFLLGVATRGGATMVVLEAEPSSGPASTLALTIDLARALGVAWRCVSDAP
ncbi:MAG: hypothetical protein JNK04_15845, partial [Myxococcales bacterium]|nr:hypothetical protein [Myxococcales bacterium]